MDLEGISKATSSNQMRGQNSVVLARLMAKATRSRSGTASSGMSKKDLENQAELMRHASELRRGEEANKAWVKTQADERAAEFSVKSMKDRITAVREASVITDEDNNVVGEISVSDKMHGISTSGYRLAKKTAEPAEESGTLDDNRAAEQALISTVPPQARSQQGTNIPGWGLPTSQSTPEEAPVTRTQLAKSMKVKKPRVTKKKAAQTKLTFSDAAPSAPTAEEGPQTTSEK